MMRSLVCLFLTVLLRGAHAQAISEPDQPHLVDESQINVAVHRTFTDAEMKVVDRGMIAFACQFDTAGTIKSISLSKLQGYKISSLNRELLQLNLRKYVKLYVPKAFRTPQTAYMREVGIYYVGKSFKRSPSGSKK